MQTQQCYWRQIPIGGGGYIRHVAIHPKNPRIVFACCDVGGVFRSQDGGHTWTGNHCAGIERPGDFCVACAVFHPNDAHTVFIATGGGNHSGNVYVSRDLGMQWERLNADPLPHLRSGGIGHFRGLREILRVDPENPETLLLATAEAGLLRSIDNGRTFAPLALAGEKLSGIYPAPGHPQVLYAPAFRMNAKDPGSIWVSQDGGSSWTHGGQNLDVTSVAVSRINPARAYASCRWDGVWFTEDSGTTWQPRNGCGETALDVDSSGRFADGPRSHLMMRQHFSNVALDPFDEDRLYVATKIHDGLWGSRDAGQSWTRLMQGPVNGDGTFSGSQNTPPGPKILAAALIAPDPVHPGRLFTSDYYGVYRSDDYGAQWTYGWRGMENTYIQHFWHGRPDSDELFIGLNDITLFRSEDAGETTQLVPTHHGIDKPWLRVNIPSALVLDDSQSPRRMYASVLQWSPKNREGGIIVSNDDGQSWRFLEGGLPHARIHGLAQQPGQPNRLLCGIEDEGIFRSEDAGKTWTRSDTGIVPAERLYGRKGLYHVRGERFFPTHRGDIVFDPDAPDTVYLAAGEFGIYTSADAGLTWTSISENLPVDYVQALRLTPSKRLLAACGDTGLFASANRGQSWGRLGQFKCHALAVHPRDEAHLLAGEPGALRCSRDAGETWADVPIAPEMLRLSQVCWDARRFDRLYAGTLGHGGFIGEFANT
ncbi:MAG: WD40/YVTN/BNR-like repeat-containing protein [Opitutales bacterium]